MANVRKVLIVGGGMAGLTAAIALKRQDINVESVELNPAWSVYGVGIIQSSNQLLALRQLGLGDACLVRGQGFPGSEIRDSQGPPASTLSRGRPSAGASRAINERRSSPSWETGLKRSRYAAHRSGDISVDERDAMQPFGAGAEETI
ncbi:MAG TPA: FAD-dependent monooxygenase [Rhizobacter sp.]|nr:FAD-dependent monooxygenase [Rhizobacter sp.]